MAKGDVKSGFKLAPIRYKDLECLEIFFEGKFYVDLTLPFGSSISCAIFEDISTLIHWIFEQQTKKPFLHYLDNYFMCYRTLQGCWVAYDGMQAIDEDIGLPLSPEKLVLSRIYWSFKELRPSWHVSVTKEMKKDLQMWIVFLEEYGGSSPIPGLNPQQLEVFLDASANVTLGWGAWRGNKWIWGGWDQTFFHIYNLSIDFLELYAVAVTVYAWSDILANKHVIVHSDNTPTVAVMNDKFAHSPNLMHLVCFLVLHCMLNNITLTAAYIPGSSNTRSDALSSFQLHRFQQLHPEADPLPSPCPSFLYPLSEHTYNNLQL